MNEFVIEFKNTTGRKSWAQNPSKSWDGSLYVLHRDEAKRFPSVKAAERWLVTSGVAERLPSGLALREHPIILAWRIFDPGNRSELPSGIHLIKAPSGRWIFVGKVPHLLGYVCKDGSTPTASRFADARHAGPEIAGLKIRAWDTREEALAALEALPANTEGHEYLVP